MTADFQVGFSILAIPDGCAPDGKKCRISLSIAPDASTKGVDLREWPRVVSEIARVGFRVSIGKISGAEVDKRSVERISTISVLPLCAASRAEFSGRATELWKRLFAHPGFCALYDVLRERRVRPDLGADCVRSLYGSPRVADVIDVTRALYGSATAASLLSAFAVASDRDEISGSYVDRRAETFPHLRWWENVLSECLPPPRPSDPIGQLTPPSLESGWFKSSIEAVKRLERNARRLRGEGDSSDADSGENGDGDTGAFANLATDFRSRTDSAFWRGEGPAIKADVLRDEIAIQRELAGLGSHRHSALASLTDGSSPCEAAGRKLAAILSYSTLANYLGFVVDLEVAASDLGVSESAARSYGAISVEVDGEAPGGAFAPAPRRRWTTFVFRKESPQFPAYFGPSPRAETIGKPIASDQPLRDGVLNLAVKTDAGRPRFVLDALDISSAIGSLVEQNAELFNSKRQGRQSNSLSTKLPSLRRRGIALIDTDVVGQGIEQGKRRREESQTPILDAEDLLQGFRIDAALGYEPEDFSDVGRWRPLMARTVEFGAEDVPAEFVAEIKCLQDRDHGHTRPMTREDVLEDGGRTRAHVEVPHSELFTWAGGSLAVPASDEGTSETPCCDLEMAHAGAGSVCVDPKTELDIDIEWDLSVEEQERPLPLRYGASYLFGARACFVNGCGLPFEQARQQYVRRDIQVVLGSPSGAPFPYRRLEEIDAPEVLLPWDDRIVSRPQSDWPGEGPDVLVVRSGDRDTRAAQRFIVPPRTTFDLSEEHGAFDGFDGDRPQGAFSKPARIRADLDQDTGSFPIARDGSWEHLLLDPDGHEPQAPGRGAVLVLDASATAPDQPYFPDPLASQLHARLLPEPAAAPWFRAMRGAVPFWSGEDPSDAEPVVLELRRAEAGENGPFRGWFEERSSQLVRPRNSMAAVNLNKLSVLLAPAEELDLEIWSSPGARKLRSLHEIFLRSAEQVEKLSEVELTGLRNTTARPHAFNIAWKRLADPSQRDGQWDCILREAPQRNVFNRRIIRLVHAVDRPLRVPSFVWSQGESSTLRLRTVAITVDNSKGQHGWAEFIDNQASPDPMTWRGKIGGATTFFVGEIEVHRPSTGRVRCHARWEEHRADSTRRVPEKREPDGRLAESRLVFDPQKQEARLFAIDAVRMNEEVRDKTLDLLRDDDHALRSLSHSFADGRARRLTLTLVATSRFRRFFEAEGEAKPDDARDLAGQFELESEGPAAVVWADSVTRPAKPPIEGKVASNGWVLPAFRWSLERCDGGDVLRVTRIGSVHLCLGTSWHSSGEGELLGVVFWPPSHSQDAAAPAVVDSLGDAETRSEERGPYELERIDLCQIDKETGAYASYVTRWGSDPIHLSGAPEDLLTPERFSGYVARASNLPLTLAPDEEADDAPPAPTLPVTVLGYAPELDERDGWFCDIEIDPGPAYFPFVQLGICRYQPHSIPGVELSPPERAWVQVPPRRTAEVVLSGGHCVTVKVHGVGYHRSDIGPGDYAPEVRHLADVPLLNVRLVRASGCAKDDERPSAWVAAVDDEGLPIEQLRLTPTRSGAEVLWTATVQLPCDRREEHFGLMVEEVEFMAQDRAPEEKSTVRTFATEMVERAPTFAYVFDLKSEDVGSAAKLSAQLEEQTK